MTESDSLFVYGDFRPFVELIDSTTVLFADRLSARLVCADLVTGVGWQAGGRGGSGPGEFGGSAPFYSSSGGFIYTATANMRGATFSRTGELVEAVRYPAPYLGGQFPMGLLHSGTVVAHYRQAPDGDAGARQSAQELRAYARDDGLVWTYPLPPIEVSQVSLPDGRTILRSKGSALVRARHSTVVWTQQRGREVVALNADGSERARATLKQETYGAIVTADERIWVRVLPEEEGEAGWYKVFDRELNFIMDVHERGNILDAWGDFILTLSYDQNDLEILHLLRRRLAPD